MSTIADHPALIIGLQAAVPLWILQLDQLDPDVRDRQRMRWAADAADAVAYGGDTLQFGGKRGEAAKVFNHLARGLAAAAFNPGGITAFAEHWCVDHAACLDADRAAEESPLTGDTQAVSGPTFRGRPITDVHMPEVA